MRRGVRAELLKFRSTRLWWGMAIGIVVSAAAFSLLFALLYTSESIMEEAGGGGPFGGIPVGDDVQIANSVYTAGLSVGYLLMLVIGVVQIGAEYRHKTISGTFLATPDRVRVMGAKVLALIVIGGGYGVLSLLGSVSVGALTLQLRGADPFPSSGEIVRTLALSLLVLGLWALIGLGAGILIPNQVAALLIAVGVAWIVEPILGRGRQGMGLRAGAHRAVPPQRGDPGGRQRHPGLAGRRPAVVVGRRDRAGLLGGGLRRRWDRPGGPARHRLVVAAGGSSGVARAPGACIARRRSDALLVRPASDGNAARCVPGVRDTRRTSGGDH